MLNMTKRKTSCRLVILVILVSFLMIAGGCAEQVRNLKFSRMSSAGTIDSAFKVNIQDVTFSYKPAFEEKLIGGVEQFKKRFVEHLAAQKLMPVSEEQGDAALRGTVEIKEKVSVNGWLAPAIPLALTIVLLPVAFALPRFNDTYEVTAKMTLVCCRSGDVLWTKEITQSKKLRLNNYNMTYDKYDSKPNRNLSELIDNVLKQTAVEMAASIAKQ